MSYGIFHDCRILNMLMQHKGCGFGYSLYLWTTSVDDVSITEESFIPSVVALSAKPSSRLPFYLEFETWTDDPFYSIEI